MQPVGAVVLIQLARPAVVQPEGGREEELLEGGEVAVLAAVHPTPGVLQHTSVHHTTHQT